MNKKINDFLFFIAVFILYIIYTAVIILFLNKIGIDINKFDEHTKNLYLIIIDGSLMVITYLLYKKENNNDLKKYANNFGKLFSTGLKLWLIGIALMITSNLIIHFLYPTATATNEDAVQEMLKTAPIYTTFTACIFAPFMEEMVFRKSLQKVFTSDILFIIFSGLLFGFAHIMGVSNMIDMIYIIPYALFGCVFAYTYVKTNNIFVSITFHVIHNTILVAISLLSIGVIK
ncbi:MAG: CPBP family intramembrane metalloprotease [Bacilli bacterium]|nr:CPBP family intramembrane metalloprotease [Bacilli bacterium]